MSEGRFKGCLVGAAVGDALGMPSEFLAREEIKRRYGRIAGFLRPAPGHPCSFLEPGQYTDDTQMLLAVARSIVSCGRFDPADVARRFVEWGTSGERPRAPGITCLKAVANLAAGAGWRKSGIDSAGCGSAMRVAPIGLLDAFADRHVLISDACNSSIITHTDPRAVAGAVAVALGVALLAAAPPDRVLERSDVIDLVSVCASAARPISSEMAAAVLQVVRLVDHPDEEEALARTGTSGYVVECVPAAFLCFARHHRDYEGAVLAAANAGDDADSIACIAGALAGTAAGLSGIRASWVAGVEDSAEIQGLSSSLYQVANQYKGSQGRSRRGLDETTGP